ncbi:MAG: hypothetical protein FWE03_00785 [Firmicutes bacterium]|nr:hypothetical protein [Bacillota bacterium]
MKTIEIEIDGILYIKSGKYWYAEDAIGIVPPDSIMKKILKKELESHDLKSMTIFELQEFIKITREIEHYDFCLEAVEQLLDLVTEKNDTILLRNCMSIKVSCLRKLKRSSEAIEFCKAMKELYSDDIRNVNTLTSLAAAYCDIEDWDTAKKVCDHAYKKQGGSVGYTNELSMVYKRIAAKSDS